MKQTLWSFGVLLVLTVASFARAAQQPDDTLTLTSSARSCAQKVVQAGTPASTLVLKALPGSARVPAMQTRYDGRVFQLDYPAAWPEEQVAEYLGAFALNLGMALHGTAYGAAGFVQQATRGFMESLHAHAQGALGDPYASQEMEDRLRNTPIQLWTPDCNTRGARFMTQLISRSLVSSDELEVQLQFEAVFYESPGATVVRLLGGHGFTVQIQPRQRNHPRMHELMDRVAYQIQKAADKTAPQHP